MFPKAIARKNSQIRRDKGARVPVPLGKDGKAARQENDDAHEQGKVGRVDCFILDEGK